MTILPYDYAPPRVVNGLVRTCRLIEIGSAFVPRTDYARSLDEATLQAALLTPPHLRSDAVVLPATKGTPEQIAAQKRTDRWFVAAVLILALCAAPFIWS